MANSDRAPARARLPSSRRYAYTPELLAHGRHRYENTEDSIPDIAVEFGIHKTTLLRLARREGWVRYAPPPRDLSGATRLLAQADALTEARHPEVLAEGEPRRMTAEGPPSPFEGGLRPPPQGDGEQAAPPAPASLGVNAADIDEMEAAVRAELATVKAMRAQMRHRPQSPLDAERTARTLSNLTATLYKLQRMRCGIAEADIDDDIPADIDAFRERLARKIEIFLESRESERGAGGTDVSADAAFRP
jgi:hypothetical protein